MSALGNVLIGLDQTLNCLIRLDGEWGQPDETLSARAWRLRENHPAWARAIDRLFFWQAGHCQTAYQAEIARAHLPNAYFPSDGHRPTVRHVAHCPRHGARRHPGRGGDK